MALVLVTSAAHYAASSAAAATMQATEGVERRHGKTVP